MGLADYLSRFPSAEAPETSQFDGSFTVAKMKMISEALKPKDKMKLRGQEVNNIRPKPTVEGERSCFAITKTVVSNGNKRKTEYANIQSEHTRSLEGVYTCNRRLNNQNRDICIPAEICKYRSEKIRRCSQYVNSSCTLENKNLLNMSSINSPEKSDPRTSAIVNTSTQSGDINLNVVFNRLNQPPSANSDSDIELIQPEKVVPKQTNSKKLNTILSFPHQFPGIYYPLVQNDKWIYSIVPTDSKVVRKIDYPEILSLKIVEANLEKDPILKTIRVAIRDRNPKAK